MRVHFSSPPSVFNDDNSIIVSALLLNVSSDYTFSVRAVFGRLTSLSCQLGAASAVIAVG